MKKIGIVVQRWYQGAAGGAESHAFHYARVLSTKYPVELLTTTAVDADSWESALPPGETKFQGITIRRFDVTGGRTRTWHKLHERLIRDHAAGRLAAWSAPLQEEWIREQGPHSTDLLAYLRTHAYDYTCLFFVTYLFSPAYFGVQTLPPSVPAFFVPTLHDEAPAYMPVYKQAVRLYRKTIWNTNAEAELGARLWGSLPGVVAGTSLSVADEPGCPAGLSFDNVGSGPAGESQGVPYLLYTGRIDAGKGCGTLIDWFLHYRGSRGGKLELRLCGTLSMRFPLWHPGVRYLGFVSEDEKMRLIRGAAAFVILSPMESLSISTLEAMSQGTPAIVNADNPVLLEHVQKSGSGWGVRSYTEFQAAVDNVLDPKFDRKSSALKAMSYVKRDYGEDRLRAALIKEVDAVISG